MSRAIAIILNNFKTFFKQDLSNMLAWRAAKSAEETLNSLMFNQGEILPLNQERTIHINATMVTEPQYHDGFFTVALDGTFAAQNQPEEVVSSEH